MRALYLLLLVLFSTPSQATSLASDSQSDSYGEPFVVGERRTIKSEVLGEAREYSVFLPIFYNSEKLHESRYPVLYVLDGNALFLTAAGVAYSTSLRPDFPNMQAPPMIVVGISSAKNRMRDFTFDKLDGDQSQAPSAHYESAGGGAKFLEFLETELIPAIDREYPTLPYRMLAGHSLGGLFVMDAMIARKTLFNCNIAMDASAWWNNGAISKKLLKASPENAFHKFRFYMSLADHKVIESEKSGEMIIENRRFAELLARHGGTGLTLKFERWDAESHGSVPLPSLYNGLRYCFEGYEPDLLLFLSGADAVSDHFKKFSDAVGADFLPPQYYLEVAANYAAEYFGKADIALDLLRLEAEAYPLSINAHLRFGEQLEKAGKVKEATAQFKRALELDPENETARVGLARVNR